MMAKRLVELRSGTRYLRVDESRDSSVIKPPSPSAPSKGVFCSAPKTGCFPLISLTKQGLNLREGRRGDRSEDICADIHQHSDRCWRRQHPTPTHQHSALQTGGGRDGTGREAEAKRVPLQNVCFTCLECVKTAVHHQHQDRYHSHSGVNCLFSSFMLPPPQSCPNFCQSNIMNLLSTQLECGSV